MVKLVMLTGSYIVRKKRGQRVLSLRLKDWVAGSTSKQARNTAQADLVGGR